MSKKEVKRVDIKGIKNPDFVKDLSYKECDALCEDIRNEIITETSKYGGHLSSNLGAVESTVSLCRSFDFCKDKIIFDVGHQTYTYKILTGRSLEGLRTKDGISGFQKMSESPYDHFECGHSSTSISVANGMAIARDLNNEDYSIIAYIGDGSLSNGLALEGLNLASQNGHKIIIVLNDNEMSISAPKGALATGWRKFSTSSFYTGSKSFMKRVFAPGFVKFLTRIKNWFKRRLISMNIFDLLGYSVIGPIDGHDIKAMDKAFAKAKKLENSVVIHIKTIKGKGYEPAENDQIGVWHGVGKFDIESGTPLETCKDGCWCDTYSELLLSKMKENEDIVTIVPATGLGSSLKDVHDTFPNRYIDVGIAEEHAATMAGALAIAGKHPVVSIYSTFLQRAYDEVIHDVARMNASVTFLVDRAGLVGADGDTHQGLYDEAFLMDMPNTIIAMASNEFEAKYLLEESLKHPCPFFIRFPKECAKHSESQEELSFGKWVLMNEASKKKYAVVSVGPLTMDLYEAIKEKNIDVTLVNALYQNPMDDEMIDSLLGYENIIIYDAYATVDGFTNHLANRLFEKKYSGNVIKKSVPNQFVKQASISEQRDEFSLNVDDILKIVQ